MSSAHVIHPAASAPSSSCPSGRPSPRLRPLLRWLGQGSVALVLLGCGRPATEEECERILERTARLELAERLGNADAKLVEAEVQATKKAMRDSMMNNCVGKRITDRALSCVQEANSSKELTEDCFR